MFKVDDFNVCDINANGHFVRIEELNNMIEEGALIVNCEKLEEYKHKTRKAVWGDAEIH